MTARIVDVANDDSEYAHAFEEAKRSIGRLEEHWNSAGKEECDFMFKVCFEGVRRPIFLWLELTDVAADHYVGRVFEAVAELSSVDVGQSLQVDKPLALDWMVNDKGVVHGGFTLLVERGRLQGADLAEFDELLMATRWVDA